MVNQPKTPARSVRVGAPLWDAAKARADKQGETLTDVIRRALRDYVEEGARVAASQVRCPLCDAAAGEPCRWPDGTPVRYFHTARQESTTEGMGP